MLLSRYFLWFALVISVAPLGLTVRAAAAEAAGDYRSLASQSRALLSAHRYREALAPARAALAAGEKALAPAGPRRLDLALHAGNVFEKAGRYRQAETFYKRAIVYASRAAAADPLAGPVAFAKLGGLYRLTGQYGLAQDLYVQALQGAIPIEGDGGQNVAGMLANLGAVLRALGDYGRAEAAYARALKALLPKRGADHPSLTTLLGNIGALYFEQARIDEAERIYRRVLDLRVQRHGGGHPDVALAFADLAEVMRAQGKYGEAEDLLRKSLALRENILGPGHADVAASLNNLATLLFDTDRSAEAEPLMVRALTIRKTAFGADALPVARALTGLAAIRHRIGRHDETGPLHEQALAISKRIFGPDHPAVALPLNNLGELARITGDLATARQRHTQALTIRETVLGADHPDTAHSHLKLSLVESDAGNPCRALDHSRRATRAHRDRTAQPRRRAGDAVRARQKSKPVFDQHLQVLADLIAAAPADRDDLIAEAVATAQLALATGTGQTVAQMASRFGAGNSDLAKQIRERQDAADQWAARDDRLLALVTQPGAARDTALEDLLRAEMARLSRRMNDLDHQLASAFPAYAELVSLNPVDLATLQGLMRPDEAMLIYLLGDGGGHLLILRPDHAVLRSLDIKGPDLRAAIAELHDGLDPLGIETIENIPEYDFDLAHDLYWRILAPAMADLTGVRHLLVVPSGGIESLPFAVLVDRAYRPEAENLAIYRAAPWLARRFAVSTLPTPSALWAFRSVAKRSRAPDAFLGFGDPVLSSAPGATRSVPLTSLFKGGLADVRALRNLARLPETAGELRALASALNAPADSVHLAAAATEARVRTLDLVNARVLAFATHGLMAGELGGSAEPALVLTPPDRATVNDDGLLSASEIAGLSLNADWVVLSACNTAAGDGTPGAEGFSGLAKAFFHAGSRALLVSHWPVASDAAAALTTTMFEIAAADAGLGGAEAFRRAMLRVMADPEKAHFTHPVFWAPFSVVGEGGHS